MKVFKRILNLTLFFVTLYVLIVAGCSIFKAVCTINAKKVNTVIEDVSSVDYITVHNELETEQAIQIVQNIKGRYHDMTYNAQIPIDPEQYIKHNKAYQAGDNLTMYLLNNGNLVTHQEISDRRNLAIGFTLLAIAIIVFYSLLTYLFRLINSVFNSLIHQH